MAYLVVSSLLTVIVYPVVSHWAWSDVGWVSAANPDAFLGGIVDFAGSGVVHMTGGVAAVVGAAVIGPRMGRFDASGQVVPMKGHSSVLQVLGTFILWMGWYGFNAGSTLGIDATKAKIAGRVVVVTTIGAAAGGIGAVVLERLLGRGKEWDVAAMCNGILAGLVSITAGCATILPWAALIIGAFSACVYRASSKLMVRLRIDDPLDAFAVHGANGCWGIMAAALFSAPQYTEPVMGSSEGGLFYGGGKLLGAACVFLVAHVAWVGSFALIAFVGLKKLALLRVPLHGDLATISGGIDMDASKGSEVDDNISRHRGQAYLGDTDNNSSSAASQDGPAGITPPNVATGTEASAKVADGTGGAEQKKA